MDPGLIDEQAFIFNSHVHWFSVRKLRGVWYNLNSTNRFGPEIISDFYFSAFLNSVKEVGYHIYVVRGMFPHTSRETMPALNKNQLWMGEDEIQKHYERMIKTKKYVPNIGG